MARLLTIQQAAEEFGPSVWFWRKRIWSGEIKNVGYGKKHLIDRVDIEAFLKQRKG